MYNSDDVIFTEDSVTIKLDCSVELQILKVIKSLGYKNIKVDNTYYGFIYKGEGEGEGAALSLRIEKGIFEGDYAVLTPKIVDLDDYVLFHSTIDWSYETPLEKKTTNKNIKTFIKRHFLSPKEMLVKDIIE